MTDPRDLRNRAVPGFVVTLGGAILSAGTLFTWLTWSIALPIARGASLLGTSLVRGKVALACGVFLLLVGVAMSLATRSAVQVPLAVVAAIVGLVGLYASATLAASHAAQVAEILHRYAGEVRRYPRIASHPGALARLGFQLSVSPGPWMSVGGALVGFVGAVVAISSRDRSAPYRGRSGPARAGTSRQPSGSMRGGARP